MFDFLSGKKTYLVLGLFIIAAALALFFNVEVPEEGWAVLVALGFGAVRSALTAVNGNKGWKTYAAVLLTLGISGCSYFGVNLPIDIIYTIVGAFGIVGVRDAVKKLE